MNLNETMVALFVVWLAVMVLAGVGVGVFLLNKRRQ
jgi:uncharacterized protein YneF (UPF0154 family)